MFDQTPRPAVEMAQNQSDWVVLLQVPADDQFLDQDALHYSSMTQADSWGVTRTAS